MAQHTMTPIKIIERAPRVSPTNPGKRIGARPEIWAADSIDGVWSYQRTDEITTPWTIVHVPTGYTTLFPSLPKARRWTAASDAIDWIRKELADMADRAADGIGAEFDGRWYPAVDVPGEVYRRLAKLDETTSR